jgi:hypothetical protein
MSKFLLETEAEIEPDVLAAALKGLGFDVGVKRVWDWANDEETEEDYQQMVKLVSARKNPAMIDHILNDDGQ